MAKKGSKPPHAVRYVWRDGFPDRGAVPEEVAKELDKIRAENGTLDAAIVAHAAARDDSPLNALIYALDNKAALSQYREAEARGVMNALLVVYETKLGREVTLPYVVSYVPLDTPTARLKQYIPVYEAKQQPTIGHQVIVDALGRLQAWMHRYGDMAEFLEVTDAIQNVKLAVERLEEYLADVAEPQTEPAKIKHKHSDEGAGASTV